MKASRQTTLQTVVGSPVKGPAQAHTSNEEMADVQPVSESTATDSHAADAPDSASVWTDADTERESDRNESPAQDGQSIDVKGKAKEHTPHSWKHEASRRASLALQFLAESITEGAQKTQSPKMGASKSPKRQHSVALRSASRGPSASRDSGVASHVRSTAGTSPAGTSTSSGTASKSAALTVLKGCSIYVDVRTDDGDDAGALFVDMLRGMGARVREFCKLWNFCTVSRVLNLV